MMLGLETVRDRGTKEPADREMAKIVMLIMTEAEVDEGVAILDQAIGEVEAGEVSDEVLGEYAGW